MQGGQAPAQGLLIAVHAGGRADELKHQEARFLAGRIAHRQHCGHANDTGADPELHGYAAFRFAS
jgi:hypothetical protein